jgi:hypothetical protein
LGISNSAGSDQTIIWVKKDSRRAPLLVHSCLSQDFAQKGMSEEEHYLHELVKGGGSKKDLAFCEYQGKSYVKGLEVIRDWDEVMTYERV